MSISESSVVGALENEPKVVGPSQLTLDWDEELAAVMSYHESRVAEGEQTWHHYLFYRNGDRVCRLKVRPFGRGREKDSVFTVGAMLAPLLRADEVIWMADSYVRVVDVNVDDRAHLRTLLEDRTPRADEEVVGFLRQRNEAVSLDSLVVLGIGREYFRAAFLPYSKRDGQVIWNEDMARLTDSAAEKSAVVEFEANVVTTVQNLLGLATEGLPNHESLVYVLSRSGYEVKMYED